MEIHSVRLDHGSVQSTMSYPQRQPQTHRPTHAAQTAQDLYKPSRSPLSVSAPARYPYPQLSPQLQQQPPPPQPQQPQQPVPQAPPPVSLQLQNRFGPTGQQAIFTPAPGGPFRDVRQHRMSLLHPEYGPGRGSSGGGGQNAYMQHVESMQPQPPPGGGGGGGGQQPLKKIRLQDHKDSVTPLRIDTREQPSVYNPQVEAISPTLPDIIQQEDQAFRTTKDQLIQQIGKVDREIAKAESQIAILKKKEQELEEVASKPSVKTEVQEVLQPKHQSLAQKIYAENRKKAQTAHAELDTLGPKVNWPLYIQPSDTLVYHENKRRHRLFKDKLREYLKKRDQENEARNNYLAETYSKLMQEWMRKVEKIESSTKRKAKEAKNREFFEKVFPELRKQREDRERFNRVGARVKSEADMEEIMDNLQEQALEDKKMRSYAVIPPILHDPREHRITYNDKNGYIESMEDVYQSKQHLNIWTPSEKELFKEKYLQHPKNFGVIASYLDRKSAADCVQFYYLSKKTENYKKQLMKRTRQAKRGLAKQKVNSNTSTSIIDIMTSGVTTRLQREQQQKTGGPHHHHQQQQQPREQLSESSSSMTSTSMTSSMSSATMTSCASDASSAATSTTTTFTSMSSTPILNTSSTANRAPPSIANSASSIDKAPSPATTATTTTTVISSSSSVTVSSTANSVATATAVVTTISSTSDKSPKTSDATPTDKGFGECNSLSYDEFRSKVAGKAFDEISGKENSGSGGVVVDGAKVATAMDTSTMFQQGKDGATMSSPQDVRSDQSMSSTTITENKKKKERRKDMENATIETSDEEQSDLQDKNVSGNCVVCNALLGPHLQSRPLVPSQASQYGLREDQVPPKGRVCNTCRCKTVRSRYTHCPLPGCPNSRGRVKRLRSFPQRFQDLPSDVREPLMAEFRIPSGVTKCCSACFSRIQRRLGPVEEWPEDEVNLLKTALTEVGANWQLIGERLNKPAHQVRSFYAYNRKRMNLESCLGDRKPTLTDEEESGSSTSSCEEIPRGRHSSDTASAESPPAIPGQTQNQIKKEDYDSSATETADEAQTPDHYQGSATITPVNNDGQPRQNASPMSVKDLVLNVIELSLMKNPGGQQAQANPPTSGGTPTISSILNNDSNEVTIVSEYSLNPQPRQPLNDLSLAKLVTPLIGATITPVPGPIPQQPPQQPEPIPSSRDDLVVLQVQDGREPETLDLSIKKPREPPPPAHQKHQQAQMHRSEPYMTYHTERKSPAFSIRSQPKLPSPKPANPKAGSITLGTPIISQQRYEGLLRQMTPETKMGSITQGTPIHMPHMQEKRVYDYYNKRGQVAQNVPQPPTQAAYQQSYRQPAYTVEQQLSSRQIIMNDYITSQQMCGRRNDKPQYYPANSPHRTPPPPQPNQQRQGVIQRHTRPFYPPGHEALSSLVDVAVQQPSLPVPTAPHEGLGKTMADNILEQSHRFQMLPQQAQQMRHQAQRIEEQKRVAYLHQQHQQQQQQQQQARQQQQAGDNSTMTAASLIDAIITHQINQTAEGGRDVHPNARGPPRAGDLLFQGFHRDPPQTQQDNGERPPSVISVDLENDTVNKNLTVKELTDTVISHDFSARQPSNYFHVPENVSDQWKRRLQQQQHQQQHQQQQHQQHQQQQHKDDGKRSGTPQQDERQIIRIAQSQKYHVEPVSPPENNHWPDQAYRRYQQPQSHISALDYVKNRIAEVMRTEDDKKDNQESGHGQDKDRSNSPGDMVIDEEKHENDYGQQQASNVQQQQQQSGFTYPFVPKDTTANDSTRNNEPKPLLSAQYEPLSDED